MLPGTNLPGQVLAVCSNPATATKGSGKTMIALDLALSMADYFDSDLRVNFACNFLPLVRFCLRRGYYNFLHRLIYRPYWSCQCLPVSNPNNPVPKSILLDSFLDNPGKMIILLDEAPLYCHSRDKTWLSLNPRVLSNLNQVRRDRVRFIWVAQLFDHVDRQLRDATDYVVEASSLVVYDARLGHEKIVRKKYKLFSRLDYENIAAKAESLAGIKLYLKQFFKAKRRIDQPISPDDLLLFKCYGSFESIGKATAQISLRGVRDMSKCIQDLKVHYNPAIDLSFPAFDFIEGKRGRYA